MISSYILLLMAWDQGPGLVWHLSGTERLWEVTPCSWPAPKGHLAAPTGPTGSTCSASQQHQESVFLTPLCSCRDKSILTVKSKCWWSKEPLLMIVLNPAAYSRWHSKLISHHSNTGSTTIPPWVKQQRATAAAGAEGTNAASAKSLGSPKSPPHSWGCLPSCCGRELHLMTP